MTVFHALRSYGWTDTRGAYLLDGGADFYNVYRCADGQHVAVGAIEPQFYSALLAGLGLADDPDLRDGQGDRARWPALRERLARRFGERTVGEWLDVFAGTDACVTEIVPLAEASAHPAAVERSSFVTVDGVAQPAPAPRFSRTVPTVAGPPPGPGRHTRDGLSRWGFSAGEIDDLLRDGTVQQGGIQ